MRMWVKQFYRRLRSDLVCPTAQAINVLSAVCSVGGLALLVTRLRPTCLAAYIAWSAQAMSAWGVSPWSGKAATQQDRVAVNSALGARIRSASKARRSSYARSIATASGVLSSTTTNSSPPRRQAASSGRTCCSSNCAIACSTRSPVLWPCASLMLLKW